MARWQVEQATVRHKQIAFHANLWGALGLLAVIHYVVAPQFADAPFMRLILVILFFGCAAMVPWSFMQPLRDYLHALNHWRFADTNPVIQRNVDLMVSRYARFAHKIAGAGLGAVAAMGIAVLGEWPQLPLPGFVQGVAIIGALACLLAIPVIAASKLSLLYEAFELRDRIHEEMQIAGLQLRNDAMEAQAREQEKLPPVRVASPMRFVAGEYEWRWEDFYKNAAIFGQSGSGKTVCVLNALLDGLLSSSQAAGRPAAGLILDPKGDFRAKIASLCRRHGREGDLRIIDPDDGENGMVWNPLDSTDDVMEVAGRFGAVMEILSPAGDNDRFWIESSKQLIQALIGLMRGLRPDLPPSPAEIYRLAMSDEAIKSELYKVTKVQFEQDPNLRRACDYLRGEWTGMPDNTRGSVRAFVSNMLGAFATPPYDTLFAGRSTERIGDMIDEGRILYVYMPIADREVMARVVSTFVKLEYYREILKRPDKKRPSFFLCDEFQAFFTVGQGRGDADAFERTRQSNHANIVAFQNLNALLKQTPRPEPVYNLLGNCATKLFLRNTDKDTNEYASLQFGEQIETLVSRSSSASDGLKGGGSLSGASAFGARIRKDVFSQLAIPSPDDGVLYAETMAHLAARAEIDDRRLRWKVHPLKD